MVVWCEGGGQTPAVTSHDYCIPFIESRVRLVWGGLSFQIPDLFVRTCHIRMNTFIRCRCKDGHDKFVKT